MESSNQNKIKPSAGRSKAAMPCRKHPKHRQSPGVCSVCLNEKLSQLRNQKSSKSGQEPRSLSRSSSYLSSLSSSDASSYASPVAMGNRNSRTRVFKNANSFGRRVLDKSRSTALVFRRRKDTREKSMETKRGFWSKLTLFPRRKGEKNKGLTHSRSTRERVIGGDTAIH